MATAALITIALILAIILESVRLNGRINLPEVRDQEHNKVAGYIYYIFGSLLTVIFFQPMIAVTAMLNLCLGDTISGIVGSVMYRSNVRENCQSISIKPFPIVVSMFLACIAIGYFSSNLTQLPFEMYLAGAIGATVADSVAINCNGKGIDDNLTIPLFSGVLMSLVLWLS
jgi:dolichol kinase